MDLMILICLENIFLLFLRAQAICEKTASNGVMIRHKIENFLGSIGSIDDMPDAHVVVQRNRGSIKSPIIEVRPKHGESELVDGTESVLFCLLDASGGQQSMKASIKKVSEMKRYARGHSTALCLVKQVEYQRLNGMCAVRCGERCAEKYDEKCAEKLVEK